MILKILKGISDCDVAANGKEALEVFILDVSGETLSLADEMALGDHGVGRRTVAFDVEKGVEGAYCRQSTVDGSDSVTEVLAVLDVGVDVVEGDGVGWLVGPG